MTSLDPDQLHPDQPLLVEEPTLADTDDPQHERGRIGYGRHERTSAWLLSAALVAIVLALGFWQWWSGRHDDPTDPRASLDLPTIGAMAPGFTLRTLDDTAFSLADARGNVVVLNFWGSWCAPCREEMPALQRYWASAPDDVLLVGVSAKQDSDEAARDFVAEYGVTYPIVRDIGGSRVTQGTVSLDYRIAFYPMTYFISPDGRISSIVIKSLTEDDLQHYIDKARDDAAASLAPAPLPIWLREA